MTQTRRVFAVAALAGACLALASQAAAAVPAPNVSVLDENGKTRSLAEFRGKTVVLEWTNEGCPYVKKHYASGNMQALQKSATGAGTVWLTVASSKPGAQGHLADGAAAKAWRAKHKASPTLVLLDHDGKVGKAFGAKTTPDMRIIDAKGNLVYAGAIDDTISTDVADVKTARNYVAAALGEVAAGRPVATPATKPYGCSIKY